jgi:hypothetical protein
MQAVCTAPPLNVGTHLPDHTVWRHIAIWIFTDVNTCRLCRKTSRTASRFVGRDSSVGIATCYGMDGPEIEKKNPGGSDILRIRPNQPWGPPSLLYNGYRVCLGGKAARAWRWPSPSSSAEVSERVELYLYSTSGPSWPVLGWTLLYFTASSCSVSISIRQKKIQ